MISITSLTVITTVVLTLTACTRSTDTITSTPATPKVDRVIPLADDPITTAPVVFFTENFEIINDLNVKFHDTGGVSDSLMLISRTDAFSGTKAAQNTYIAKDEFPEGADPGGSGWLWCFFGDNKIDTNIPVADTTPRTRVFARWYHKFEEGFTP